MKKLFKITSLLGASNLILLLSSIIKNKIIAVVLGSSGLGIVSQVTSFLNLLTGVSNFGIQQGTTKYTAEFDEEDSHKILFASLCFIFFTSAILLLITSFFNNSITQWVFYDQAYRRYVLFAALSAPFISSGIMLSYYYKGKRNINLIFKVNMISAILGLLISILLIIYLGIKGAVYQVVVTYLLSFALFVYYLFTREKSHKIKKFYDFNIFKNFILIKNMINYGAVISIAHIFSVLALLIIKSLVVNKLGFHFNGIYQSVLIISGLILSFPYETLWSYYFPTVCKEKDVQIKKIEFTNFTNFLVLTATPIVILIFLTGKFIIPVFFSDKFMEAVNFLNIRLLGDIFYLLTWPVQALFLADKRFKYIVIFGIAPNLLLVLSSLFFLNIFSFSGIFYGYLFSMIISFGVHVLSLKKKYPEFLNNNAKLFKDIILSILVIIVSFIALNIPSLKSFVIFVLIAWFFLIFKESKNIITLIRGYFKIG